MKKFCRLIILFILVGVSHQVMAAEKKLMVLTYAKPGLFACFFGVLANLRWCEKKRIGLVVKWGNRSLYFEPNGYFGATDPWEYYFEPISMFENNKAVLEEEVFTRKKYAAPDGSQIPSTLHRGYRKCLEKPYRRSMNKTITDYIRIKPRILDKVHSFYDKHLLGKKVIGIHLRGTDKGIENKPISIEIICKAANLLVSEIPDCVFFVATDEEQMLAKAKELLNGPVFYYDSFRSVDGKAIHTGGHSYSRAQMGEEVLIEALLLSKSDKFVHTKSNVSTAVLFFNPELENVLVN